MNKVYLGLGSNLGDREDFILKAISELEHLGTVLQKSRIIETPPWGITNVPNYLNIVILIETAFLPLALINKILEIEKKLGRERDQKWGSRVIDIDILFFNDWIINTESLNIPHPFIVKRMFVLAPLLELNELYVHPVLKKNIAFLHRKLQHEFTHSPLSSSI